LLSLFFTLFLSSSLFFSSFCLSISFFFSLSLSFSLSSLYISISKRASANAPLHVAIFMVLTVTLTGDIVVFAHCKALRDANFYNCQKLGGEEYSCTLLSRTTDDPSANVMQVTSKYLRTRQQ
jgi:hypothetical protein